jgi:hypothetical protein
MSAPRSFSASTRGRHFAFGFETWPIVKEISGKGFSCFGIIFQVFSVRRPIRQNIKSCQQTKTNEVQEQ